MPDADGYTRLAMREVHANPYLSVESHEIRHPNGRPGEHVLVRIPRPSGIVVLDGDEIVLARQARFAARREVLEIVKGGAAPDESALDCAKRELLEELGCVADRWDALGDFFEIPSIVAPAISLFLARDVRKVQAAEDDIERISPERHSMHDALRAAVDGRIVDAVTVAALFLANAKLNA